MVGYCVETNLKETGSEGVDRICVSDEDTIRNLSIYVCVCNIYCCLRI
jgi:hypothetical protein